MSNIYIYQIILLLTRCLGQRLDLPT